MQEGEEQAEEQWGSRGREGRGERMYGCKAYARLVRSTYDLLMRLSSTYAYVRLLGLHRFFSRFGSCVC